MIWEGVMFIHDGPYSEAVLRFTINFELDFPRSRPVIKLGPDVYHREFSYVMELIAVELIVQLW